MRPFGSKSDGKTLQLVQRGTDKRIPVELVKQPSGEVLDPAELEGLHVMVSSESGMEIATIPYTIEDKKLVVEVTADVSRHLGLGVYTMTATGRIPDEYYADGYHDYEIVVPLCKVTKYGSNETPVKVQANVLEGLKGKDGLNNYQLAVKHGYQGTEEQFAKDIIPKSNYERAKELEGFVGTEEDYLQSLHGAPGESIYDIAVRRGFVGSEQVYLESQKGKDGKDAYQTYLETTTDSTPMTKKQWANANDFFYQFIFRILKGAGVRPTETDMTADQVYELDRQRREIISAIKSKGVPAKETNGIEDLARLIGEIQSTVIVIHKEQQMLDWLIEESPTIKIDNGYSPASLRYTFGRCYNLRRMPAIIDAIAVTNVSYICASCVSMASASLPDLPQVTTASSAFSGCTSLTSLTIGDVPKCRYFSSLASGDASLRTLNIGNASSAEDISQLAVNCANLTTITASFGNQVTNAQMAFYGCSALQRIDGDLDLSSATNVSSTFGGCSSLEEVRIKGIKVSLDLSACTKLSMDSVRYLLENVQEVSSQRIDLNRKLLETNEEALGDLGDTASGKGWTINYR